MKAIDSSVTTKISFNIYIYFDNEITKFLFLAEEVISFIFLLLHSYTFFILFVIFRNLKIIRETC